MKVETEAGIFSLNNLHSGNRNFINLELVHGDNGSQLKVDLFLCCSSLSNIIINNVGSFQTARAIILTYPGFRVN